MANDHAADKPNRQAERADVTVEVGLEFDSFQGFLSEYSSNISTGGMFVKTTNPPPVGTVLRFSLKLKGDFQLIKGTGEVTWVRMQSQGPRLPSGIGIRFLSIPDAGVDLIQKIVERYREQGGRPFDVRDAGKNAAVQEGASVEAFDPFATDPVSSEPISTGPVSPGPTMGEGSEVFTPDIFIPPDVIPQPGTQGGEASTPPPASRSEALLDSGSRATPKAPRQVRLSLVIFLVLAAGVAGALAFTFGERLVNWASGYDSSLEQRQVFDVPPPVSLNSQQLAATPAVEEAPAAPAALGATPSVDELSASVEVPAPELALNRVRLITWKEDAEGGTRVTFWGDGHLTEQNLVHVRFGDRPPRELLKLQGVNWPFRDPVLDVGSDEVRRIRTGFHPKSTLNELHIVIDLADPEVRLVSLERGSRNVELLFRR